MTHPTPSPPRARRLETPRAINRLAQRAHADDDNHAHEPGQRRQNTQHRPLNFQTIGKIGRKPGDHQRITPERSEADEPSAKRRPIEDQLAIGHARHRRRPDRRIVDRSFTAKLPPCNAPKETQDRQHPKRCMPRPPVDDHGQHGNEQNDAQRRPLRDDRGRNRARLVGKPFVGRVGRNRITRPFAGTEQYTACNQHFDPDRPSQRKLRDRPNADERQQRPARPGSGWRESRSTTAERE